MDLMDNVATIVKAHAEMTTAAAKVIDAVSPIINRAVSPIPTSATPLPTSPSSAIVYFPNYMQPFDQNVWYNDRLFCPTNCGLGPYENRESYVRHVKAKHANFIKPPPIGPNMAQLLPSMLPSSSEKTSKIPIRKDD